MDAVKPVRGVRYWLAWILVVVDSLLVWLGGNWRQVLLAIMGGCGLWLIGGPVDGRTLGFALCLAAQPLWIWETIRARQWGMLAMALWFTAGWLRGLLAYL